MQCTEGVTSTEMDGTLAGNRKVCFMVESQIFASIPSVPQGLYYFDAASTKHDGLIFITTIDDKASKYTTLMRTYLIDYKK
jgi:hypothetical protein